MIPRSHERASLGCLLESLVSAFISQYPNGLDDEPYPDFRTDALDTLGRCIMDRACWSDGKIIVGKILHPRASARTGLWGWFGASGDFSASMLFCLKYLPADRIEPWLKSAFDIPCPYWRAQLMVWLLAAHNVLLGDVAQPSGFGSLTGRPNIDWEESFVLTGNYTGDFTEDVVTSRYWDHFLPERNRLAALGTIASVMTKDVFEDWQLSIAEVDDLDNELGNLPEQFHRLYQSTDRVADR